MSLGKIFTPADYRHQKWKNGRGDTTELYIEPAGSDFTKLDFQLRISSAVMESDGLFSRFPGYERALIVLEGEGVHLKTLTGETPHVLRNLSPVTFSGENDVEASLISGPVRDLNVFWKRGSISCALTTLKNDFKMTRDRVFIYAHGASISLSSSNKTVLLKEKHLIEFDSAELAGSQIKLRPEKAGAVAIGIFLASNNG